jgi:hypothetical protein
MKATFEKMTKSGQNLPCPKICKSCWCRKLLLESEVASFFTLIHFSTKERMDQRQQFIGHRQRVEKQEN